MDGTLGGAEKPLPPFHCTALAQSTKYSVQFSGQALLVLPKQGKAVSGWVAFAWSLLPPSGHSLEANGCCRQVNDNTK